VTSYQQQYFNIALGPELPSLSAFGLWAILVESQNANCRDAVVKATIDHRPDVWIWLGDNAYNTGKD